MNPPSLKQDGPALIVFALSLLTRAALQAFGGPNTGDISWITTFGGIAASWIGISARLNGQNAEIAAIKGNTDGILTGMTNERDHALSLAHEVAQAAIHIDPAIAVQVAATHTDPATGAPI